MIPDGARPTVLALVAPPHRDFRRGLRWPSSLSRNHRTVTGTTAPLPSSPTTGRPRRPPSLDAAREHRPRARGLARPRRPALASSRRDGAAARGAPTGQELVLAGAGATPAAVFDHGPQGGVTVSPWGRRGDLDGHAIAPGLTVNLADDRAGDASVLRLGRLHVPTSIMGRMPCGSAIGKPRRSNASRASRDSDSIHRSGSPASTCNERDHGPGHPHHRARRGPSSPAPSAGDRRTRGRTACRTRGRGPLRRLRRRDQPGPRRGRYLRRWSIPEGRAAWSRRLDGGRLQSLGQSTVLLHALRDLPHAPGGESASLPRAGRRASPPLTPDETPMRSTSPAIPLLAVLSLAGCHGGPSRLQRCLRPWRPSTTSS